MLRGTDADFKTRVFARFAKSEGITDGQLTAAIVGAERGLIDADLGGGVIKLRIARPGTGKSRSFRTLLAYRTKQRAVFLYGFAKKARANIAPDELENLKLTAGDLLAASDAVLTSMVEDRKLIEVSYDTQED